MLLRTMTFVTTWQSSNKFFFALAATKVLVSSLKGYESYEWFGAVMNGLEQL